MPIPMPHLVHPRWRRRAAHLPGRLTARLPGRLALLLGLMGALGCQGDHLTPPAPLADPAELYWSLELSHHAVTLSTTAPYDTLTITATPKNYADVPQPGVPVYTTTDAHSVVVTADGVLLAVAPTPPFQPALVIATLTMGNLKHADSMYVQVVDNPAPPVLASVSIHPIPPDSAKRSSYPTTITSPRLVKGVGLGYSSVLPVRVTDTNGNPIVAPDLHVYLRSSDTTVFQVVSRYNFEDVIIFDNEGNSFSYRARQPGTATLYATTTMFGVTKADTLLFRVGLPVGVGIDVRPFPEFGPGNFFTPIGITSIDKPDPEIRIGVGGFVYWDVSGFYPTPDSTDVVFADLTNIGPLDLAGHLINPNFYPSRCGTRFLSDCTATGNFVLPPITKDEGDLQVFRSFPVPGVYEFQNPRNGARGRIVVVDEQ